MQSPIFGLNSFAKATNGTNQAGVLSGYTNGLLVQADIFSKMAYVEQNSYLNNSFRGVWTPFSDDITHRKSAVVLSLHLIEPSTKLVSIPQRC